MLFIFRFCLFIICLWGPAPSHADQKKLNISFVSPNRDDSRFWGTAHDFARASANDLNIDFKIYYNRDNNRFTYLEAFQRAVNAKEKPDAVLGVFFRFIGDEILEMARCKGIPVFMLNANIPDGEEKDIGSVRGKYKNFIGHMAPDEKAAGHILASYLIQTAKKKHPGKKIEIAGLSGHRESPVSLNRGEGLARAAKDEKAKLRQVIYIDWTQPEAQVKEDVQMRTKVLLTRYKKLDAFWFVSDAMALEGKAVMERLHRDVITGGIDWKKEAILQIKNRVLHASVGGHFTEIGFSLVLLHDYLHGKDFYDELGGRIKTRMTLLTMENIDRFHGLLTEQNWDEVDFSRYSKILHPELKRYDFSFETLLNTIEKTR
ncbi:ABC transporter substrate-binding protein [Desulfospira joergensenii]|uniref:ABC transporter substrate-binding protein n=1 Tax=Desulfospira joergensenii TaxID=53329 RepID=UPI0003B7A1E3|nr:ABC transporter substrate-binding protein [Desulfospira joergensenii]